MSVLVQRPHQMPGVIVLPRHNSSSSPSTHRNRPAQPQRHHTTNPSQVAPAQVAVLSPSTKASRRQRGQLQQPPSSSSPHRSTPNKNDKRRSHQNAQPTAADNSTLPSSNSTPSSVSIISGNSSSSATVSASHSPVLSSASPVINQTTQATTTTTPPRKGGRQQQPKSAPNTPSPANSLPVPANRRRARSPRPTQKLPGLNLDELLDDEYSPAKKNHQGGKKAKVPIPATVPEPATWQQAALLKQSHPSGGLTTGSLVPLVDPITAVASHHHTSYSNPPSPTRTTPPKGSVFDIAHEHGLSHSSTMPNLSTPNRRTGGMHARAPSVPSYSTFPPAKPISSLDALFSGLTVDSAPVTPLSKAGKAQHTRGQSVSSSLPPSTSLHARMAAAASAPSSASRRERTLTGNNAGYIKFAGASFQAAPDAMMLPRPAFGGMLARRGGSHSGSGSSDEDEQESSADERTVSLSEEEETGVFAF